MHLERNPWRILILLVGWASLIAAIVHAVVGLTAPPARRQRAGFGGYISGGFTPTGGGGGVLGPSGGGTTNALAIWASANQLSSSATIDNGTVTTMGDALAIGELDLTTQTIACSACALTDQSLNANTTYLRINCTTGACNLHGIVAPTRNRCVLVGDVGTNIVTVQHESATETTAANRISLPNGVSTNLWDTVGQPQTPYTLLCYDLTQARWSPATWAAAYSLYNTFASATVSGAGTFQGGIVVTGTSHVRCNGTAVSSLSNATCSSTNCTDCGGTISTTSTAPAINFQGTYTGADDAICQITPLGTAAAAASVAHTATQLSFTATSGAKYMYSCIGGS